MSYNSGRCPTQGSVQSITLDVYGKAKNNSASLAALGIALLCNDVPITSTCGPRTA